MSAWRLDLKLPLERWEEHDYLQADAEEAVAFAASLNLERSAVGSVFALMGDSRSEPTTAEVTTDLEWRADRDSFSVRVTASVEARDSDGGEVLWVDGDATATWSHEDPLVISDGAARTFALSLGAVEPIRRLALAMQKSMEGFRVRSSIAGSDELTRNLDQVYEVAGRPPMDSHQASPLNQWALAGIAGDEAAEWEQRGFPLVDALPWAQHNFGPAKAAEWIKQGLTAGQADLWRQQFPPFEAAEWIEVGLTVDQAVLWGQQFSPWEATTLQASGYSAPDDVERRAFSLNVPIDVLVSLVGVVAEDQIVAWWEAIRYANYIEVDEVSQLVGAGLTPSDVARAGVDATVRGLLHPELAQAESKRREELREQIWNESEAEGWEALDLAEAPDDPPTDSDYYD